jgi:predicted amidohydrolase YtcJ
VVVRFTLLLLVVLVLQLYGSARRTNTQERIDSGRKPETASNVPVEAQPADLVLKNGAIYTVDSVRSWAQALAVRGGRLVYVGNDKGAEALIGRQTRVIDLNGKMVLPGFHDSHAHPIYAGIQRLTQCDLTGVKMKELITRVKNCAVTKSKDEWILGFGWDPSLLAENNPPAGSLDSAVRDQPVLLRSGLGGQSIWVNSRAMSLAGITAATPDPKNGHIERDPKSGNPIGIFRGTARSLIYRHVPPTTAREYQEALRYILTEFSRFGIVSFVDAYADPDSLAAYAAVERRGSLTARVRATLPYRADGDGADESQMNQLIELGRSARGKFLRANSVKLHIDGMIDTRTAALLEPYAATGKRLEDASFRGLPNYEADRFNKVVARLDREGFQVHIHAVGDRGVRIALDAFEYARRMSGARDSRHVITHLYLVHPEDVSRFRQLGVIANTQPVLAYPNDYNIKLIEPLVGAQRTQRLYPVRSLMESGAIVTASSDWPDSSLNPLDGIQVAMTRNALNTSERTPLIPEQRTSLADVIAAYTIAGAYQNFSEGESGSLEVGKRADFVVLNRNLFAIPVEEIHQVKVLWTVLEGKETFRAISWSYRASD